MEGGRDRIPRGAGLLLLEQPPLPRDPIYLLSFLQSFLRPKGEREGGGEKNKKRKEEKRRKKKKKKKEKEKEKKRKKEQFDLFGIE